MKRGQVIIINFFVTFIMEIDNYFYKNSILYIYIYIYIYIYNNQFNTIFVKKM